MTIIQLGILAFVSTVVTIPCVILIPRARQSRDFDRVLWLATWVLAFLGAWGAPGFVPADLPLSNIVIENLTLIQVVVGALAGALSINLLLWVLDRFEQPSMEEDVPGEESDNSEES